MKRIGILLLFLTLGCATAPRFPATVRVTLEQLPALGDPFPIPEGSNRLMVASAQTWPYQEARVQGILYDVASDTEGRVAYIGTSDPAFKTPEGLSIRSTLAEVMATGAEPPWREPGWADHTKLSSGWNAAFIRGFDRDGRLKPQATVAFFFQR